ncbi:MAG TPA: polyribonucleotide nucleotidyltransferase [Candidatus Paceibacterota bacterium]
METKKYQIEYGGKPLSVELGRLAQQASGSCLIQYGETAVLVTATMSGSIKPLDYMPLTVEYEEKYYAAGKIKGSKWIKRETRPSEEAILSGRLIDRTIRPRFDQGLRNEIQVVATVLSFDSVNDPDMPALFGASLALSISDIPFNGPVAGVRVGRVNDQFIMNPTYKERIDSDMDVVVAGTSQKINMIEAGAKIVPEDDISNAILLGFKSFQELIEFQNKIINDVKPIKREVAVFKHDEELREKVSLFVRPLLENALYIKSKQERALALKDIETNLKEHVKVLSAADPKLEDRIKEALVLFEEDIDYVVHENVIKSGKRPDGRKTDELRNINTEVGILPHTHGSGLFNRGETQALSILTLAAPGLEQWIETMEIDLTKKRFMHHYFFPPFSTGEVKRMGSPGRREIGHGALAERALLAIIPSKDVFPYTIRVVSEILSSNGSSSMASVCGSTLAMMDGGVPIVAPAAGIAMGLMFDEKGEKYKVLTDIQGPEDHYGDMDLKVAGTREGITALQMDVKVEGIHEQILTDALAQARKARLEILDAMQKALKEPRAELSAHAPRVKMLTINPSKIGALIGPQGKVINDIIEKTGVNIDIDDDGSVFVTSTNPEGMEKAIQMIQEVTYEAKAGDEFTGKVTRLLDFGAMVEYSSGKEGLVHVSEISQERIRKPSDVLKLGQLVKVKVKNIDEYGRINLTMKN